MRAAALVLVAMACGVGCGEDPLAYQAKVQPLSASQLFADGTSARPLPRGVVARGEVASEGARTGAVDGKPIAHNPLEVTAELMQRGRQRFDIYCSPCHGLTGEGDGMIVRRGFPAPPALSTDQLRQAGDGHLYEVIWRGFGRMPSYASQVAWRDRWAIVAYVRALQLSQRASVSQLPADVRAKVERGSGG